MKLRALTFKQTRRNSECTGVCGAGKTSGQRSARRMKRTWGPAKVSGVSCSFSKADRNGFRLFSIASLEAKVSIETMDAKTADLLSQLDGHLREAPANRCHGRCRLLGLGFGSLRPRSSGALPLAPAWSPSATCKKLQMKASGLPRFHRATQSATQSTRRRSPAGLKTRQH